ncbi:hypothetical protein IAT38_002780 [Cryptococcus sp. DSM 104549]
MSLFKRKQSKGDVAHTAVNSPPTAHTSTVGVPLQQGQRGPNYGSVNGMGGTPPMGNPRRMTSNPQLGSNPPPMGMHVNASHPDMSGMNSHQPPFAPGAGTGASPQMAQNADHRASHAPSPAPLMNINGSPSAHPPITNAMINNTSYPWMVRPLRLFASTSNPPGPTTPFPRYGLSVPSNPSHSGHMLIFGGLVNERVANDMWSMDIRELATMPVKTKGDAPMPRVGHASVIADRIMIVWGGDTKVNIDDPQDEGLYILDLRSQEWTSVPVQRGPVGRYGHAVCIVDGLFYVFGGQADGAFMNDLWVYDVRQLSGSGVHRWEQIRYASPPPPPRTGHVLVAGGNGKIYLFGGTDGNYHYNDTWSFDPATGTWTELSCIGYIPLPREGHAAAVVDDTVYIFGGRDVKGKDLGDLAAFKLSNQRWYMFQNMGPAPTARSGHAMVAAHGKIFIVGGEANQTLTDARDDPAMIHILDTSKIKYPADSVPPGQRVKSTASIGDSPQKNQGVNQSGMPQGPGTGAQGDGAKRHLPGSASQDGLAQRAMSPQGQMNDRAQPQGQQPMGAMLPRSEPAVDLNQVQNQPPVQAQMSPQAAGPRSIPKANGAPAGAAPPQRPRREGDDEFREAMSPTMANHPPLANGGTSPSQGGFPARVTSPTHNSPASPRPPKMVFNQSVHGARSPSPRMRMADGSPADRAPPPPDAFYYGRKSPTTNGFGGRPSSLGPATGDLIKELKAKDGEIETAQKREAALKVILRRAVQQGFVAGEGAEDLDKEDVEVQTDGGDERMIHKLADSLVRLKHDKAEMQNNMAAQIRLASEKAAEADTLRRGALQETAFYRAKIAALESNSLIDLKRLDKERISELERQVGLLSQENAQTQKELEAALDTAANTRSMYSAAAERESETLKRAEEAEEAQREVLEEMELLRSKAASHEQGVREHAERSTTLSSTVQQREAELDGLRSQLEEAIATRDANLELVTQAQAALTSAGLMTGEMEALYTRESARAQQLEDELAEVRAELEARNRDAESANYRFQELNDAWSKSREEADSLRAVTAARLGQLLDSHKEMRADETRAVRGHQEQLRALEEEGHSLRKMLREAGQRVDAAESGVSHHRNKTRELETKVQALRGELRASQTKLMSAQAEVVRYKELHTARDSEVREKELAVTEVETRCNMLRNLLADHGIAVNASELENVEAPSTRELETQLRDGARAHEAAQREIQDLRVRCEEAEDKVESLGRLVERIKDARSPTSASMRSPTPTGMEGGRVGELEKRLVDLEKEHKDKVAGLEADYQTAVRYVKGTEKMLKRMKDELNKQKATNATIQSELDHLRGRSSASGRSTPSSSSILETDLQRRLTTLQNQHQKLQEDFSASQDVLSARNREVDLLRMRVDETERELEGLREDYAQAQHRIQTLLDVRGVSETDDEDEGSEEASMAFDKLTNELKQWERSRSPGGAGTRPDDSDDDDTVHIPAQLNGGGHAASTQAQGKGHKRGSSEYSGDWTQ